MLVRLVAGAATFAVAGLVLDQIHDRRTEIEVACIGLTYCLIAFVSRRWKYVALSLFALAGMAAAKIKGEPFDQALRREVGLPDDRIARFVGVVTVAAIAALCAFRLVASLSGHGWDRAWAPVQAILSSPPLEAWLGRL